MDGHSVAPACNGAFAAVLRKLFPARRTFLLPGSRSDLAGRGISADKRNYLQTKFQITKAVEKENGGHGDAVNCGLAHATGKYFKVVDSDDWVDKEALKRNP